MRELHETRTIRVVLGETSPVIRAGIQAVLYDQGIREPLISKDPAGLAEALRADVVDLFVCDADVPGIDLCSMTQLIRQNVLGLNPFVVIVATLGEGSACNARRLINAGVDEVLRKPLSISDVVGLVSQLTETRRPFVATDDYVGPTRRSALRPDDTSEVLLRAPNTLRSRVVQNADTAALRHLIGAGVSRVAELRLQSTPQAIARAIRRVHAFYAGHGTVEGVRHDLRRIAMLASDMATRHRDMETDHLATLADGIYGLILSIAEDLSAPPAGHLRRLDYLGQVCRRIGGDAEREPGEVRRIAESVGRLAGAAPASPALPFSLGVPALR